MKLVPATDYHLIVPCNPNKVLRICEAQEVFADIHEGFKMITELPKPTKKSDEIIGFVCQIYNLVEEENDGDLTNQKIWTLGTALGKYIFSQDLIVEFCRQYKEHLSVEGIETIFLSRNFSLGKIIAVDKINAGLRIYYEELGDIRIIPFNKLQVVTILSTIKAQ